MGPLVNRAAVDDMMRGLETHPRARRRSALRRQTSGRLLRRAHAGACARRTCRSFSEEIFAPILYLLEFDELEEAIALAQ